MIVTVLKNFGNDAHCTPYSDWPRDGWIIRSAKIGNPGCEMAVSEYIFAPTTEEALNYAFNVSREIPFVALWPSIGYRGEGPEYPPFYGNKSFTAIIVRDVDDSGQQRFFRKGQPFEVRILATEMAKRFSIPER
jgi:hypothetical protein